MLTFAIILTQLVNFNNLDTLSNVVVSAHRGQQNALEVPFAIEKIALSPKNSRSTPDALLNATGVFIQKTNQGGGSAFVRGLTGNQTLLIYDGIRFNNATFRYGPNQYLNTIESNSLADLEVLKGTGSVQYGSDALTGLISLQTLKPQFNPTKTATALLGTQWASQGMEASYMTKLAFQSAKTSLIFLGAKKHFGDLSRGGDGALQVPSAYGQLSYFVKIRQQLGTAWEIEALSQLTQQNNVPVYHKVVLENFLLHEMTLQQYQRNYVKAIRKLNTQWANQVEFTASLQESIEGRSLQKKGSVVLRQELDHVTTKGLGVRLQSQWSNQWSSNSGVEYYHDGIQSSRKDVNTTTNSIKLLRGLYPDQSSYQSVSIYSLHHYQWNTNSLDLGLRQQNYLAVLPDTSIGMSRLSNSSFVYSLGYSKFITPNQTIYVNTSTGFRAPNLDDLGSLGIVDFRYELPAYQLKPEYSRNVEIGYKLFTKKSYWSASIFYSRLQNLIARVKTSETIQNYSVYKKVNVDEAFLTGIEIATKIDFNRHWNLNGQVSYIYGESISLREPMRRIPPLHGNIELNYMANDWVLGMNWSFAARQNRLSIADRSDNRMNPSGTPGWGILNLHSTYKKKMFTVSMQAINLGNVLYRMHGSGMDGMRRSVHLQLFVPIKLYGK